MFRISVTSLEKFRRVIHKVSRFDTEESLIENLSGTFQGNEYTHIGYAFHKILETGKATYIGGNKFVEPTDGGYVILSYEAVESVLILRKEHPGNHEVHAGKDYKTPYFDIHVHGYADLQYDSVVRDAKTKYSTPHAQDYKDSCQWTFYLDMFDCSRFYFDVFEFSGYKKSMGLDTTQTTFIPYSPIECIRDSKMIEYNQNLINQFCKYIYDNNLFHLLKLKEDL